MMELAHEHRGKGTETKLRETKQSSRRPGVLREMF